MEKARPPNRPFNMGQTEMGVASGREPVTQRGMTDLTATSKPAISSSLFAFAIFYGGMVCIAGVLGNKQVALGPLSAIGPLVELGPLAVEAGIFAFLMLVVTSSSVAELHGRETANKLVLIGFVPLICSLLLSLVVLSLPPAHDMDPQRLAAFETIMGGTPRIWLGGILAYGVSTLLNVSIFSRLKGQEGEKLLWLRSGVASALSQIVDTLIFITVAFYGVFPIGELLLGQMMAKVVLSVILVPPLIYAFVALGRRLDGQ
jgi:queuosine precursor transporter